MTNYTTSDFTDIRGQEEKPTVPGWYASYSDLQVAKRGHKRPVAFRYWDGNHWRWSEYGDLTTWQSRYWFGLKEKP